MLRDDQVLRVEELVSNDRDEARLQAFLAEARQFAGFEPWGDRREVEEFKFAIPPGPATNEAEGKLCGLAPVDELAYRFFFASTSRITGRTRFGQYG